MSTKSDKKMAFKILSNGLVKENPTLRLVLGTCPTLAVTTSAINGIGMGLATTAVLVGSNAVISMTRKVIPDKVRIPAYVTIIAGFVTIVQLLLKAYLPALDKALGIFIPLIVVNCIILARAEMFANKNTVPLSILDGIGMGLGFTMALLAIGSVRELLGNGTLFGITITANLFDPAIIMILPPGGFLAFGIIIGLLNKFTAVKVTKTGCNACDMKCGSCGRHGEVAKG
ncbi:MAG: electron transport complex subunit E [Clostridia bacterium]|nr:electron transport complex subunit E [Clostridia bacterium]